jgi:hypothetical protein
MDDDREVSRLHRVNRTIKELVRDRVSLSPAPFLHARNKQTKKKRPDRWAQLVLIYLHFFGFVFCLDLLAQGYEVSDAEINVSLEEFKASDPISKSVFSSSIPIQAILDLEVRICSC